MFVDPGFSTAAAAAGEETETCFPPKFSRLLQVIWHQYHHHHHHDNHHPVPDDHHHPAPDDHQHLAQLPRPAQDERDRGLQGGRWTILQNRSKQVLFIFGITNGYQLLASSKRLCHDRQSLSSSYI